ncbi:MAG: hypothetical protein NVS3B1_29460 [Marmoricola sp.]
MKIQSDVTREGPESADPSQRTVVVRADDLRAVLSEEPTREAVLRLWGSLTKKPSLVPVAGSEAAARREEIVSGMTTAGRLLALEERVAALEGERGV